MTVDEYILAQSEEIRPLLISVRNTICTALPEAEERFSWQMPTYWRNHNLIHFAAQKKHLGIYPGAAAVVVFKPLLDLILYSSSIDWFTMLPVSVTI